MEELVRTSGAGPMAQTIWGPGIYEDAARAMLENEARKRQFAHQGAMGEREVASRWQIAEALAGSREEVAHIAAEPKMAAVQAKAAKRKGGGGAGGLALKHVVSLYKIATAEATAAYALGNTERGDAAVLRAQEFLSMYPALAKAGVGTLPTQAGLEAPFALKETPQQKLSRATAIATLKANLAGEGRLSPDDQAALRALEAQEKVYGSMKQAQGFGPPVPTPGAMAGLGSVAEGLKRFLAPKSDPQVEALFQKARASGEYDDLDDASLRALVRKRLGK